MIPLVGDPADFANTIWYSLEGDAANAALSAMGMVPFLGEAAIGGKMLKGGKTLKALKLVDLEGKTLDDALDSAQLLKGAEALDGSVFKFDNAADFNRAANSAHPNIIYEFDGITYRTDSAGPESVKSSETFLARSSGWAISSPRSGVCRARRSAVA